MIKKYQNYLWLLLGAVFLTLSNGRYAIPIAAWLYPIFIIYFMRQKSPLIGYISILTIFSIANLISFWGVASPDSNSFLQILPILLAPIFSLIFLVDRIVASKLNGLISTLVFPLTYTSFDFILTMINPLGSTGILAYTQYYYLSFIQIVSITGPWGVTFLVAWFGSLANWIWESSFNWIKIRKGILLFSFILITVLLYGEVRLNYGNLQPGTVRVAGLHVYDLRKEINSIVNLKQKDWNAYRQASKTIQDKLLSATIKEARVNAKIVIWSEISPIIPKEDEDAFVAKAQKLAKEEQIYLAMSLLVDYQSPDKQDENKLLIIDPSGEIALKHFKYGGNMIEGTVPGDRIIRYIDTPYGRISGVICWDQDFPQIMVQSGRNSTDIMLVPNADWFAITPMHTHIGVFRAIENGYSMVRQNMNGLSMVTDPYGRVIASMNHFNSNEWVMVAQVPTKGVKTIYSIIGDVFGWLSIVGLIAIIIYALYKKRTILVNSTRY